MPTGIQKCVLLIFLKNSSFVIFLGLGEIAYVYINLHSVVSSMRAILSTTSSSGSKLPKRETAKQPNNIKSCKLCCIG